MDKTNENKALEEAKAEPWRIFGVSGMPADKIRLAEATWDAAVAAVTWRTAIAAIKK